MAKRSTPPVYIYELRDPRDGRTYYVGKSHQPRQRFRQHLMDVEARPHTAKARWVREVRAAGHAPRLAVAETVAGDEWRDAEAKAIRAHIETGSPLTNDVIPGEGRHAVYVNMRSQDFWDDLTPQFPELRRRVVIFESPEGLLPHFWWNLHDRGWREYQVRYHASGSGLVEPLKPWGYNRHSDIADAIDWREEATLARVFAPTMYDRTVPIADLYSTEQLSGYGMAHAVR